MGNLTSGDTSQETAIKMLKERNGVSVSEEDRVRFYQEAVIMSQFNHENIMSLLGVVVSEHPIMVLEYLARGCLQKYLRRIKRTL